MQFTDHLDKIKELGFTIEIIWNTAVIISYENPSWGSSTSNQFGFKVLYCSYLFRDAFTFEELIECCCDFFYSWYNKNLATLNQYETLQVDDIYEKLIDSILGDITKQVYRDNSIDIIFE